MNALDKVLDRVNQNSNKLCIVENDTSYSYKDVFKEINKVRDILKINKIASGHSVCLIGDYSIRSIAFLISLIDIGTILIPLTESTFDRVRDNLTEIPIDFTIDLRNNTEVIKKNPLKNNQIQNSLLNIIKNRSVPGLILFTSGSSGKPKAVVHDFSKLLKKFETKRPAMKTINFLMFDHWGGLNTFLHCFSNNSLIILPTSRNPNYICSLIEKNEIELLPTTPSFLNILLLGGTHKKYNLSSLKVISYGAEPMPAMTLSLVNKSFKNIKIQQTYGMIEIGYIGVDSPFTDDGYFITGDSVEQDGDWIRILGRKSELINVGGEKVYPAEVETIILENEKILDTVVYGSKNPLLGQIVSAKILINKKYKDNFNISDFKKECANRMPKYMVPSKIQIVDEIEKSERGKKIRKF